MISVEEHLARCLDRVRPLEPIEPGAARGAGLRAGRGRRQPGRPAGLRQLRHGRLRGARRRRRGRGRGPGAAAGRR
nr:hypothetical protein [Angustibacter aerolatus]